MCHLRLSPANRNYTASRTDWCHILCFWLRFFRSGLQQCDGRILSGSLWPWSLIKGGTIGRYIYIVIISIGSKWLGVRTVQYNWKPPRVYWCDIAFSLSSTEDTKAATLPVHCDLAAASPSWTASCLGRVFKRFLTWETRREKVELCCFPVRQMRARLRAKGV